MAKNAKPRTSLLGDLARGAVTGLVGGAAVVALDGVLTRVPSLNGSAKMRAFGRLGVATALVYGARRLHAPALVSQGLVAGAVLVTGLDVAVAMIGRCRLDPPPARTPASLGAPWAPQPLYTVPARRGDHG